MLRFVMCGSVDDGKSTLIGRLLYDNLAVLDDQLKALECDSRRFGTRHGDLDFALLVDGLQAEREQAITIDVAHRFFRTPKRAFIVADAPGHEQYTRNMATAASTAEAAVVLVDARHGVVSQTRRHTRILGMFGVSQVILAVNKMDLVGWSEPAFAAVVAEYESLAAECGIAKVSAVPTCAVDGDNVATRSDRLNWYRGQTLTELLESADPASTTGAPTSFRMPVQLVVRPHDGFRGFAGRVVSGTVKTGDRICVLPSGATSRVQDVIGSAGPNAHAGAGDSIMLTVDPPVDVSRGDVLCSPEDLPEVTEQFEARLLWMGDAPMIPGRQYLLKLATRETPATVTAIKFRDDVESGAHLAARTLSLNETALVNFSLAQPVVFEPYHRSRTLGGFILIDRETFATVGAGMIYFGLRRDANIHWQSLAIDREARAQIKQQRPVCLWLTGLSGSGKSTIANLLEKRLHAEGRHTYVLDGDNVRHGLNRDLGFTEADRVENIRRVSEVAKLMVDAGLIVIVSFISPFRAERRMARQLFDAGGFIEVFVDTPIEECEKRDPKGLYAKVRAGQLANFTGVDSPYERPESPEVRVATAGQSAEASAEQVYRFLSGQ